VVDVEYGIDTLVNITESGVKIQQRYIIEKKKKSNKYFIDNLK